MTKYKVKGGDKFSREQQVKLYQAIYDAQAEFVMAEFNRLNPNQLGAAGGVFGFLQNISKSSNKFFGLTDDEATKLLTKQNNKDFGVDFNSGEVDTDSIEAWLNGPVPSASSKLDMPECLFNSEPSKTQMPEGQIPACLGQINHALAQLDFLDGGQ